MKSIKLQLMFILIKNAKMYCFIKVDKNKISWRPTNLEAEIV